MVIGLQATGEAAAQVHACMLACRSSKRVCLDVASSSRKIASVTVKLFNPSVPCAAKMPTMCFHCRHHAGFSQYVP